MYEQKRRPAWDRSGGKFGDTESHNGLSCEKQPIDEIAVFFPGISTGEHRQRALLRDRHNSACLALSRLHPGVARNLFLCLRDHCEAWKYAGAPLWVLKEAADTALIIETGAALAERMERLDG